jgi:hypothetical protein
MQGKINLLPNNTNILTKSSAYIIGVLLGDGNIMYDRFRIAVKDKDFVLNIQKNIKNWTNYNLKIKKIKNNHFKKNSFLYYLVFNSKFIQSKIKILIKKIKNSNNKSLISLFLAGCYDSEGSVDKNRLRIRLSITNKKYKDLIINSLNKLQITYTSKIDNITNFFIIRIYGYKNLNLFKKFIRFSIQRKQRRLIENLKNFEKKQKYEKKKRENTLILKEKNWCCKYNLTRNQYYRHKNNLIKNFH